MDEQEHKEIRGQIKQMPAWELREYIEDWARSPAGQLMREAGTPRLYVTFTQHQLTAPVDPNNVVHCEKTTFGPYLSVQIIDDEIRVEELKDDDVQEVILATALDTELGILWTIEDGRQNGTLCWVKIGTLPNI